jgi:hypothetical protein
LQVPLTLGLSITIWASRAPSFAVLPTALMHCPTATCDALLRAVTSYLVDLLVVTIVVPLPNAGATTKPDLLIEAIVPTTPPKPDRETFPRGG